MKRWLRTEVGERIDQPDFQHGVETGPRDAISGMVDGLLVGERPAGNATGPNPKFFVVQGFTVRHAGGDVWSVEKDDLTGEGKAVMAFREGGEVKYGCVLVGGASRKQIDISPAGFPNATYGVYVRLEFRDEDVGNRLFWNATASTPVEFPRSIATRRAEDWSVTFEQSSPGPEWMHIADVSKPGSSATDRRDFFFEGRDDESHLVVDEEWGDTDDRQNFRATQGVFGFYRFVRAVQRLIQDIKADGVGWWVAPTYGLEELLALDGSRFMAGDLLPSPNITHDLGSSALKWAEAWIQEIWVGDGASATFGIDPPLAAPGTGHVGTELTPFAQMVANAGLWFQGGGSGFTALRVRDAAPGAVELVDQGGPVILNFNDTLVPGAADAAQARIVVDGSNEFVDIQSGIGTAEGDNDLRLNATDVYLSQNCEGQNGLVYVTVDFFSVSFALNGTGVFETTLVVAAPASGQLDPGDRVIGISPDATLALELSDDFLIAGARIDFVNNITLRVVRQFPQNLPAGRFTGGSAISDAISAPSPQVLTPSANNIIAGDIPASLELAGVDIEIRGSSVAANNGSFPITASVANTSISYTNVGGGADAAFQGSWKLVPSAANRLFTGTCEFAILRQ